MRRTGKAARPPPGPRMSAQCARNTRPPASRFLRSFRAHSRHYVSERIAKRCRCGPAAAGEHESERLLVARHEGFMAASEDAQPMSTNIRLSSELKSWIAHNLERGC